MNLNGKKVLMVIAPEGFQEIELFDTKSVLESHGAEIVITSKDVASAKSSAGTVLNIDVILSNVSLDQYHAIIFIGGPGTTTYFNDEDIFNLAKAAVKENKIIGAICIAPSILANAGLLENKKVTSFPSEITNLEEHGAKHTGEEVTVDGIFVTASGPTATKEFGEKISELLNKG